MHGAVRTERRTAMMRDAFEVDGVSEVIDYDRLCGSRLTCKYTPVLLFGAFRQDAHAGASKRFVTSGYPLDVYPGFVQPGLRKL